MPTWIWLAAGGAAAYFLIFKGNASALAAQGDAATIDAIKQEMTKKTGLPYDKCAVTWNGVDQVLVADARNAASIIVGPNLMTVLLYVQKWTPGFMIGAGSPGYQGERIWLN